MTLPVVPIAVIVPAYQASSFIDECLDGVFAQDVRPEEIVVIDDGSTDDTADRARKRGVRVIVQENRGVAHARNIGIAATSAPFVALLDADDRWRPGHLSAHLRAHETYPSAMMQATDYALLVDGVVGPPVAARFAILASGRTGGADATLVPRGDVLETIARANFVLPSSMFVDRRIFSEHDVWFLGRDAMPAGDAFQIGEDFEWLLRVLKYTDVTFINRPSVEYRRHAASLSAGGGSTRYGDAKLGEMIAAAPERYATGAGALFAAFRTRQLRESAAWHLRAGNAGAGREVLTVIARERRGLAAVAYRAAAAALLVPGSAAAIAALARIRKPGRR